MIPEVCEFPLDGKWYVSRRNPELIGQFDEHEYLSKDGTWNRKLEPQFTRRWFLSPEMVKSEVVATCFKCIMTSMEHRAREHFTYRGKRIYGPHFDVDALHSIADQTESRQ